MLYFLSANKHKLHLAKNNLTPLGIKFEQDVFPFVEIQSDNPKDITIDKANQAFKVLQKPLFVTDDSWYITALNDFPGAYMRHVNGKLKEADFLRLMQPYSNREIILHRVLCYIDDQGIKTFEDKIVGEILQEATHFGEVPLLNIISFLPSKKSVAQAWDEGTQQLPKETMWRDFAEWYREYTSEPSL